MLVDQMAVCNVKWVTWRIINGLDLFSGLRLSCFVSFLLSVSTPAATGSCLLLLWEKTTFPDRHSTRQEEATKATSTVIVALIASCLFSEHSPASTSPSKIYSGPPRPCSAAPLSLSSFLLRPRCDNHQVLFVIITVFVCLIAYPRMFIMSCLQAEGSSVRPPACTSSANITRSAGRHEPFLSIPLITSPLLDRSQLIQVPHLFVFPSGKAVLYFMFILF